MANQNNKDKIFTPELVKILKIFGIASLLLVLSLSFFNEKRANNSGEDRTFKVNSSNRLFFLNLRAIHYDRESRTDAKMTLFSHKDRKEAVDSIPNLELRIILNSLKDEAYIYLEPVNLDWPINLKAVLEENEKEFSFENGNRELFFGYVNQLKPWIEQDASFWIKNSNEWKPLWQEQEEKEAIKETLTDYFKLLEDH